MRNTRKGFYCLMLVVIVLSLASMACTSTDDSSGWIEEVQKGIEDYDGQFGDAIGIADRLEDVTSDVFD